MRGTHLAYAFNIFNISDSYEEKNSLHEPRLHHESMYVLL
jgi:hypothetical protein